MLASTASTASSAANALPARHQPSCSAVTRSSHSSRMMPGFRPSIGATYIHDCVLIGNSESRRRALMGPWISTVRWV